MRALKLFFLDTSLSISGLIQVVAMRREFFFFLFYFLCASCGENYSNDKILVELFQFWLYISLPVQILVAKNITSMMFESSDFRRLTNSLKLVGN